MIVIKFCLRRFQLFLILWHGVASKYFPKLNFISIFGNQFLITINMEHCNISLKLWQFSLRRKFWSFGHCWYCIWNTSKFSKNIKSKWKIKTCNTLVFKTAIDLLKIKRIIIIKEKGKVRLIEPWISWVHLSWMSNCVYTQWSQNS